MRKTLVSLTSAVALVGALLASSAAVQASPYYGGHHNHHNHHSGPGPVRCLVAPCDTWGNGGGRPHRPNHVECDPRVCDNFNRPPRPRPHQPHCWQYKVMTSIGPVWRTACTR